MSENPAAPPAARSASDLARRARLSARARSTERPRSSNHLQAKSDLRVSSVSRLNSPAVELIPQHRQPRSGAQRRPLGTSKPASRRTPASPRTTDAVSLRGQRSAEWNEQRSCFAEYLGRFVLHPLAQQVLAICASDFSRFFSHYSSELRLSSPQLPQNTQTNFDGETHDTHLKMVHVIQETQWRAVMKALDVVPTHVAQNTTLELFWLCATCFTPELASSLVRGDTDGAQAALPPDGMDLFSGLRVASKAGWDARRAADNLGNETLNKSQTILAICGLAMLGVGSDGVFAASAVRSPAAPAWGSSQVRLQSARHSPSKLLKGTLIHLNAANSLFPTALGVASRTAPPTGRRRQLSAKRLSKPTVRSAEIKRRTPSSPPQVVTPPIIRGGVQQHVDMGVYIARAPPAAADESANSTADLFDKVQGAVQRAENILHAAKLQQAVGSKVPPKDTIFAQKEFQLHQEQVSADQWVLAGLSASRAPVEARSPSAYKEIKAKRSPGKKVSRGASSPHVAGTPRSFKSIKPRGPSKSSAGAGSSGSQLSPKPSHGSRASSAQRTGEQSQQQFNPVVQLNMGVGAASEQSIQHADSANKQREGQTAGPAARKAGAQAGDKLPSEVSADPQQPEWQEVEVEALLWDDYAEVESVDSEAYDWAVWEK